MNAFKLALVATIIALSGVSESQAAPEPTGFRVEAYCYSPLVRGYDWLPIATFDTNDDAEDYVSFLLFLYTNDYDKLLDELDLPKDVFFNGLTYRVVAEYPLPSYDPAYNRYNDRQRPSKPLPLIRSL